MRNTRRSMALRIVAIAGWAATLLILLAGHVALSFPTLQRQHRQSSSFVVNELNHNNNQMKLRMALGDYTIELQKPLGMILEEVGDDGHGVYVKEVVPDGAAARSQQIVPRDVLLTVDETDVSKMDFDSVMSLFIGSESSTVRLTLGDGLGMMDMPKNVVNQLKTQEDAYFVDAVVRQAVREIRKDGRLGDVLNVEVIVGAGIQESRGMVRFFAIFSTDGVSTYSCNVSATGLGQEDGSINIVSLSCAKDEGLGRTYDLIQE